MLLLLLGFLIKEGSAKQKQTYLGYGEPGQLTFHGSVLTPA